MDSSVAECFYATTTEREEVMGRAQSSGLHLSEADSSLVLAMIQRGDRQHDIAAWFGVNQGRIKEAKDRIHYPAAKPASQDELLPQGSPGPRARKMIRAITRVRDLLQSGRETSKATQILEEAIKDYSTDA